MKLKTIYLIIMQIHLQAFELVYRKTVTELNQSFVDYVKLFTIDEVLEQRMKDLLKN